MTTGEIAMNLRPGLYLGVLAVSLVVVVLYLRRFRQNSRVARFRNQAFSDTQLVAMGSLWQWYNTGQAPASDPLRALSQAELADLLKRCSIERIPVSFRRPCSREELHRICSELKAAGMEEMHLNVTVGMFAAGFGPAGRR